VLLKEVRYATEACVHHLWYDKGHLHHFEVTDERGDFKEREDFSGLADQPVLRMIVLTDDQQVAIELVHRGAH